MNSDLFYHQESCRLCGKIDLHKILELKPTPAGNNFLTLEEKDLKLILLGFDQTLVRSQLKIISKLKDHLKKNSLLVNF